MTDIEQQARKEAEEKYPDDKTKDLSGQELENTFASRDVIKLREGYAAALIHERSKPSLMVGFSEEEIERLILLADSQAFRRDDGELMMSGFGNGYFAGLRLANTRSISLDRILEVARDYVPDDQWEELRSRLESLLEK